MRRHLLLLITLLATALLAVTANAAPRQSLVPGGVAIFDLGADNGKGFRFRNKPVLVSRVGDRFRALVGIPLSLKPGEYYIERRSAGKTEKKFFRVADKQYSTQHITIKDKRKVNPYAEDMDRIRAEQKRQRKAAAHYSDGAVDVDLVVPVEGINTGSFGRRRVFNGEQRRPHSGMDIAADSGTPVLNPSPGKVIDLGDFFFSGKLVYVDHGQGMISLFAHLSEIAVELGQQLGKGEMIGRVGATGRVTGPHLHWSLGLNGTWIDPILFLPAEH